MKSSKLLLTVLTAAVLAGLASCNDDADTGESGGRGGQGAAPAGAGAGQGGMSGGAAGNGNGNGAVAGGSAGGTAMAGAAGEALSAGTGGAGLLPEECGDPQQGGVLVYQDITEETTWSCPLYTLTQPIYVHASEDEPTVLHISAGVTIRGVKGAEPVKLPGALVITRTGRLNAIGTRDKPIVFTTSEPPASAEPGSWGGVMLLGRAGINVPPDFEASGRLAGEAYAEALPRTPLGLYGWPDDVAGSGGAGAGGGAGAAGAAGEGARDDYESWSCGRLEFARIEYAGFKAGSTKELNGLTLAGCGWETIVEHVQVHRSSDDGIEVFGGSVNLKRVVLTGNQDDSLDWDQGWRGSAQFVAIQTHDDADTGDSCGIEADGYATPDAPVGLPSAPQLWNLTLILSQNTQRGLRLRDGTEGLIANALLVAEAQGVPKGLIDVDHVLTADNVGAEKLRVVHSVMRGGWPSSGQADSEGTVYLEQDFFTGAGQGAAGNVVIGSAAELWQKPFNPSAPEWVPSAASVAKGGGLTPTDSTNRTFVDASATYRGAFEPGGQDWTSGWTSYP